MDAQPTNKEKIEAMVRAAGLRPESRRHVRDFDLLLADGFSLPPHGAWGRFGVDPTDFPLGCYVTFWWLMKGEERLFVASPLFFELGHDPQYIDTVVKKRARLNAAEKTAREFVGRMQRLH